MNIDKLKKVIQQANPEIMEFKMGCEVEIKGDKYTVLGEIHRGLISLFNRELNYITEIGNDNRYTILGRPITLADVLIALNKTGRHFAVDSYGTFFEERDDGEEGYCWEQIFDGRRHIWNLKDNLDAQSETTKQFLIDILCTQD